MNKFILYHHKSKRFAEYVNEFSCLNGMVARGIATLEYTKTPDNNHQTFSELPDMLRELLFFAKPDVIICYDDGIKPIRPIFAFELTNHIPLRDHWLQRFNNLVGCAQTGVPGAYVIPFDLSNRKPMGGKLDSAFFYAYDRIMEIHDTPFYISDWGSTDKENLNFDGVYADLPEHNSTSMQKTFMFVNLVIESAISGRPISDLMRDRLIVDLRNDMRRIAYSPIPQVSNFKRLTKNMVDNRFLTSTEFEVWVNGKGLSIPTNLPDRIKKRDRNLIFSPIAEERGKTLEQLRDFLNKRIKDKGADPYLGQPLAFDYIFCRLGKTPYERDANLIIDLSYIRFEDFACYHRSVWGRCPLQYEDLSDIRNIPEYTMFLTEGCSQVMKNFIRVYGFTADIIVFGDGMVYF